MVLKKIKKNWSLYLGGLVGILVFDLERFLKPIIKFTYNISTGSPFDRYVESNAIIFDSFSSSLLNKISNIFNYFVYFDINQFLLKLLRTLSKILIYGINYGLNIIIILYLLYYLFISSENDSIKYSKKALLLVRFNFKIKSIFQQLRNKVYLFLSKHKLNIVVFSLIILFFSGYLLLVLTEVIIFTYYYFKASFDLTTHILLFDILKSVIILVYKYIPLYLIPILYLLLIYYLALYFANNRLKKNHDSLKVIAKYEFSFINIITGPPGSGKTRSVVALSLATVENFIDELEEILFNIEINFPHVNFAEIISDSYQHLKKYPDHYYYHELLTKSKSMIASAPFSILDPYADDYSVILDFDYIRPNVFNEAVPLEEFKIIAISELDKEYNSHYNKSDVGEDGLHLFMGTVSHWLKRHGRIYIDYQQPTQVPLNVRGNAETFFLIKKNKVKTPFVLSLFKLPFFLVYSFTKKTAISYSFYRRRISKKSFRNDRLIRKRFDYTLIYSILRHFNIFLYKILNWFDSFKYTIIYGDISNVEGDIRSRIKLKINSRDEKYKDSFLYDSTFLSKGYENKKKASKVNWDNARVYSSIHPTDDELKSLHSKFIDKAFFNFDSTVKKPDKKKTSDSGEIKLDF